MTTVVVVVGLLGIAALAAAVPHVLSWPYRLRWLIAANSMPDPWGGLAPDLLLEEVSVQSTVCSTSTTVWLIPPARRALPACSRCRPSRAQTGRGSTGGPSPRRPSC